MRSASASNGRATTRRGCVPRLREFNTPHLSGGTRGGLARVSTGRVASPSNESNGKGRDLGNRGPLGSRGVRCVGNPAVGGGCVVLILHHVKQIARAHRTVDFSGFCIS